MSYFIYIAEGGAGVPILICFSYFSVTVPLWPVVLDNLGIHVSWSSPRREESECVVDGMGWGCSVVWTLAKRLC